MGTETLVRKAYNLSTYELYFKGQKGQHDKQGPLCDIVAYPSAQHFHSLPPFKPRSPNQLALLSSPVHKGALGIHQVELVVQAGEDLGDGSGVGDHAHCALHLGQVAAGHHSRGLVVDAALEAGGAPVHELFAGAQVKCRGNQGVQRK